MRKGLPMEDFKRIEEIFKAFCDESRLRIINSLRTGEKCACTLLEEVPVAQSTLSHHMKILLDSGIVSRRKDGKWTYYSLSESGCEMTKNLLDDMLEKSTDYKTYTMCT